MLPIVSEIENGEPRLKPILYHRGLPEPVQKILGDVSGKKDKSEKEDASFIIVGESIIQKEGYRASHQLVARWYLLEGDVAYVPHKSWERSCEMVLRWSLLDEKGQEILEIPERCCYPPRYNNEIVFISGGPVTGWWSDGTMELTPREHYRSEPEVMVFFPALTAPSNFDNTGSYIFLRDCVEIHMHFDVAADDIPRIKKLTVAPELPALPKSAKTTDHARE